MAAPFKTYVKSMARKFDYFANWAPGVPRQLGDIGEFQGLQFKKVGHLDELGISFDIQPDPNKDDIQHQSERGVSVTAGLSGDVTASPADIQASVSYEFTSKGAFSFHAKGVGFPSIKALLALANSIKEKLQSREWNPDWAVVTQLAEADGLSVLISSSSSGKIDLTAKGDFQGVPNLADASAGFKITHQKDMSTAIIAEQGPVYPMFRVHGFRKKGLLGDGGFGPLEMAVPQSTLAVEDLDFMAVSPAEVLFSVEDEGDE